MLFLLAMFNASNVISRFTRVAEELFGMLISVLFLQQAIKGIREEFKVPRDADYSSPIYQFKWLYVNGLLGVIFSIGYTALRSRRARSWLYGQGWLRGFIADYGVPLLVNVWTTFSYTLPKDVPSGVPRRLFKSTSLGVKFTATLDRSKESVFSSSSVHICCHSAGFDGCMTLLL